MHVSHLMGAGAALAALGWFLAAGQPAAAAPAGPPPSPPVADGHHVLVVEGDRNALAITAASAKRDPWAGVPKGLTSAWSLTIRDGRGEVLATVPLDVTPFATGAGEVGQPVRVEGCIVRDARIGMLVNAPAFAAAASYTFTRDQEGGAVVLGTVAADRVRALAGGGR